jgi:hypothetical protein
MLMAERASQVKLTVVRIEHLLGQQEEPLAGETAVVKTWKEKRKFDED